MEHLRVTHHIQGNVSQMLHTEEGILLCRVLIVDLCCQVESCGKVNPSARSRKAD